MSESREANSWAAGANNIAPADRLPANSVRQANNVDVTPGGKFMIRAGYEKVYDGVAVRGVLALGPKLLIADGTDLVEFDGNTNSSRVLRTIAGSGRFTGFVHNDILYFCTANECLEYNGQAVRRWGVEDVLNQPSVTVVAGALRAGYYQIAMTYTDADGREGGTDKPLLVYAGEQSGFQITLPEPPAGLKMNVYVSSVQGETPYLQGTYTAQGVVTFTSVRDDLRRLRTTLLRAPTPADHIVGFHGVLFMGDGKTLYRTAPMMPHLVDRKRGFFQFPVDIGAVMATDDGVFVSADVCYFLANTETKSPQQRIVLDFPAIAGTAVHLPDGRAAWMTKYGQAVSQGTGLILVNRESYSVGEKVSGAAAVVENNGSQMIVTSTNGGVERNALAASDYFFGEILNP